ncbi:MAG: amino acid ABC transporter ATP-binding protein [Vicinamibacterales bacterium]
MSAPVVRIGGLGLLRGDRVVLEDVSLDMCRGEVVALMGASGSGKTTLLRTVAGLERFDRGAIAVDDVMLGPGSVDTAMLRRLRQKVGMVFQFHCLFEHLDATRNVALALVHVHRVGRAEADARSMALLRQLGVDHRAAALPAQLSGGEAQRVAVARALATDPPLLLMDEPTASLDPERREELATMVKELAARGRTLLIATHDADFAELVGARAVKMVNGRIVEG